MAILLAIAEERIEFIYEKATCNMQHEQLSKMGSSVAQ
jgi:hypothetical protein